MVSQISFEGAVEAGREVGVALGGGLDVENASWSGSDWAVRFPPVSSRDSAGGVKIRPVGADVDHPMQASFEQISQVDIRVRRVRAAGCRRHIDLHKRSGNFG